MGKEIGSMKLIRVQIADRTGDTTQMMEPQQAKLAAEEHSSHWLFIDNQMVLPPQVAQIDWNEAESVRLMSPIVGGYSKNC